MGFVVTFGSSAYTPGLQSVMEDFNVSTEVALLGLSLYVVGIAAGPMLAAPISETLGRRAVYLITFPIAALWTLGAGYSHSITALLICRFFAGFFGSPTLAVGAGTNADVWPPLHRAVASALFLLAPFAGPGAGPIIAGYAAQYNGWRWTQWCALFFFVAVYVYSAFIKETYKKIILQTRAKKLGIPPPIQTGPARLAKFKFLITVTLFRPIHMIFTEPIVGFFSIYIAFNFSVLFGFFDAFPIVFQGVYGFDIGQSGLAWVSVLIGCAIAVATVIIIDRVIYRSHHHKSHKEGREGVVAPEHRLYAAMMGSLGIPIGLFWFAWTARKDVHWISPVLAALPFAWGNLCVFVSIPYGTRNIFISNPNCPVFCGFISDRYIWPDDRCVSHGCKWLVAISSWSRVSLIHHSE
jgi:MFS family permease